MVYPVWETYYLNPGLWVGIIAVVHVFISHFAVGGGIYLWYTDRLSVRQNDPILRDFVKKHTWFFLLLTMVLGGLSGVGIWFIIGIASPRATATLINQFVFLWAIEWVFFLVEILALLIYHYKFEELSSKIRLRIALIYAFSAWMSLFIINGIITFMLTPGKWLETKNVWDGFFNPSSFPSLGFRTGITILMAGLFGIVITLFLARGEIRKRLLCYNVKWLYLALVFMIPSAIWYFSTVPEEAKISNFLLNRQVSSARQVLYLSTVCIYVLALFFMLRVPILFQRILAFVVLTIGFLWIGSFEHIREYARRPYIIYGYMYSTGIKLEEEERINSEGFLSHLKWTNLRELTEENKLEVGKTIFKFQCLVCHSVGGFRNDIIKKTEGLTYFGIVSQLYGQGKVLSYMPKFLGNEKEREALAAFITKEFLGKDETIPEPIRVVAHLDETPFSFDMERDEYVILAYSVLGMKCISDVDRWMSFLYPGSTIEATVIKRGEKPEIVFQGVELRYQIEKGFENPSKYLDFWKYVEVLLGKRVPENLGIDGKGLNGTFEWDEKQKVFRASVLPVSPYREDGTYNPYPILTVELIDLKTGKVLQRTKLVVPVSTEFRCYVCHDGGLRFKGVAGFSEKIAINILKVHDKNHRTNLYKEALKGKPVFCQRCHPDFIVKSEGIKGHNSLSASIHGWHANYIFYKDSRACNFCHPDHPEANTRCYRDLHKRLGLECIDCHGDLDTHAASLLLGERDSRTAGLLLSNLKPSLPLASIHPRKPWINEPDCLNCHKGYNRPYREAKGYTNWTSSLATLYRNRKDNTGKIPCLACHGPPHAVYPSFNPYGINKDNLQPLQYQKNILPIGSNFSCEVCHKRKMHTQAHHPNLLRPFRNNQILKKD